MLYEQYENLKESENIFFDKLKDLKENSGQTADIITSQQNVIASLIMDLAKIDDDLKEIKNDNVI
ncbi:MAG: hypothetical protein H0V82_01650 [Candidatus Protochlamydia sp.]|nr:hypothetical protein [Candidatus Protochlamydia sp.]